MKKDIVWFDEVDKGDVGLVGGKGANLGEMTQAKLPIPFGFIVTSEAYFDFIKANNLTPQIKEVLKGLDHSNQKKLEEAAKGVQKLILDQEVPHQLATKIISYYDRLTHKEEEFLEGKVSSGHKIAHQARTVHNQPLVAVRSSATAEDLPDASFAGQQETYLNVRGEAALVQKVKECWASLFTPRAIFYRDNQGYDHFKVGLAAVVQRMAQSDRSGIAFSIDPVTSDKSKIVIEAIFGLGEYIVQGKVTPDHYEVAKGSFTILKKEAKYQEKKFVKHGGENVEVKLAKTEGTKLKLTDEEIVKMAVLVKEIEDHYYFPQDIEWAIEAGRMFIVQSRPITTIKDHKANGATYTPIDQPIVIGSPASPGIAVGPVVVVTSPAQIGRVKTGDVLVAPQTDPDYVPAMKKAAAIVTEKGGRTSHAAIVSRELGIPAVVGAEGATSKLHTGMVVSVDGARGEVYKGSILSKAKIRDQKMKNNQVDKKASKIKTVTKVYVNLAEPEEAEKVAKMNVDGIGLLRAEFMIAAMGTHPKYLIKKGRGREFSRHLQNNIEKFVTAFNPRQVVYRATDFKTNEYRNLKGGREFEPTEENPMLGFRGASRYIANPDVFSLELDAIARIWEKGYRNLHLMIPFVRAPWELMRIKDMVESHGLLKLPGFKLWMMVEVPASALALEEFIKVGITGVSIGTNDLTMMLLGVDRDNEQVAGVYDERTPVVVNVLENIVKTCVKYGITCSICGQAASDYPEIVEKLVAAGITSVSVTPDAVTRTRETIHAIEKKLFKK